MPAKVKILALETSGGELPVPKKKNNNNGVCKKCRARMKKADRCLCRAYLCFKCCECGMDCDLCSCGHKRHHIFIK